MQRAMTAVHMEPFSTSTVVVRCGVDVKRCVAWLGAARLGVASLVRRGAWYGVARRPWVEKGALQGKDSETGTRGGIMIRPWEEVTPSVRSPVRQGDQRRRVPGREGPRKDGPFGCRMGLQERVLEEKTPSSICQFYQ